MRAAKADDNQPEIVQALRAIGASVAHTHMVGRGFPDIAVGYRGLNYLIEIKDGDKQPSKRKLTPQEQEFFDSWRGQVAIAKDAQEAIDIVTTA